MKGRIYVLEAKGEIPRFEYTCKPPALGVFQDWVGGHLEAVHDFHQIDTRELDTEGALMDCVVFCNEEGKLKGLPYNAKATELWQKALDMPVMVGDVLVGSVVIVTGDAEFLAEV